MTTPEFKIANKTKAGGQVPLEKAIDADISTPTSPKPSTALGEPEAPSAVNATQDPVEVIKSSNDTGFSHRKDKGNDTTGRSKEGKDKGKDQVTVTVNNRKHSTPPAVESEDESSEDTENIWAPLIRIRRSSGSASPRSQPSKWHRNVLAFIRLRRSSGFASPRSQPSKLELNKCELVMIKEKISHSKGEEAKLIIRKEEARCKHCSNIFEEDNVLKMKCRCKPLLIHEPCATEWSQKKGNNKCDVCKKDMQDIPVTLSKYQSSDTNRKGKTQRLFGCFGSQGS